jgi:5'-phosphate synthase pdxT subunit
VEALPIRLPAELAGLDGLIIPGGESTSISKLMQDYDLVSKIESLGKDGLPILGTCAGMILLASQTSDSAIKPLGLMDITVRRNAFGRQQESFEAELSIPAVGEEPFPGVFIRAPIIEQANGKVEILAKLSNGTGVAARQGRILVSAFHPELTSDLRFHRYFLDIVGGAIAEGNH